MRTRPSPVGEMKESCFSAEMPERGWNQCVIVRRPALQGPVAHRARDDFGYIEGKLALSGLDLEQL